MSRARSAHVDTLTIEAYAAHLVDADAEAAIEGHLICCEGCRAQTAAASELGDLPGVESVPPAEYLGRRDGSYRRP